MALKLFDRIATLMKADAHGVLESLEERSLLLKQYVREAEIEIDRKRARLEALRDEEKRLAEELARGNEEIRSLDEDVALALAGGKDDLARFVIRRLLARRAEARALRARAEQCTEESRALGAKLAEQETRYESLRARARAELNRRSEPAERAFWPCEAVVADEEVEIEMLRRRGASDEPKEER
jgi:phage shock protein A